MLTRVIAGQADGSSLVEHGRCKRCALTSLYTIQLLTSHIAISDAVRTSLGPRGMDKMVRARPIDHLHLL